MTMLCAGCRICLCLAVVAIAGCADAPSYPAGYSLPVPAAWTARPFNQVLVPGKTLAAWNIPGGGNAAVFTQLPHPVNARQLLTLTENQARSQPGWKIIESDVRTIGGAEAMWIQITGPGDGELLAPAPTGEAITIYKGKPVISTTRLWLAVIRAKDVFNVQFHFPSSRDGELDPVVDGLLKGCKLDTQ